MASVPTIRAKGLVALLADRAAANGCSIRPDRHGHAHGDAVLQRRDRDLRPLPFAPAQKSPRLAYGHPLLDSAIPNLLDAGIYFPDGQIEEEDYEYGSFLQSKMFARGVTCSNCHEPHGLKLRAPGNQVCAQCHLPAKFDTAAHVHHKPGSAGAQCANCHMPTRTYMVVDARRDHAIRIPRPDLSVALGTPNACNNCHGDRSAQWAADQIAAWFGPSRRSEAHYGSVIEAGRRADPEPMRPRGRFPSMRAEPGIVRATALSLLPSFAADFGPDEIKAYLGGLKDGDPLLRLAAVEALAPFRPTSGWWRLRRCSTTRSWRYALPPPARSPLRRRPA